jgi:hypothetical protein
MKRMRVQRQALHLRLGDDAAGWMASLVQCGLHPQADRRVGVANQVDHRLKGAEGTAAPVLRDVTKQAMLDLVPLAGARREVRDMDRQVQIIGQALQFLSTFPCTLAS